MKNAFAPLCQISGRFEFRYHFLSGLFRYRKQRRSPAPGVYYPLENNELPAGQELVAP